MPEVSEMVWNDFFSHFSLNADGSRSYDGVQVKRNAVFADAKGHWAQNAIENTVAEGLFSGVTDTSFAPNTSATRGMLMTVLARYAGKDTNWQHALVREGYGVGKDQRRVRRHEPERQHHP